jgi:serine/threonine protein kinase
MPQPCSVSSSNLHNCRQLSIITDYIQGWNLAELTEACIKKTGSPLPEAAIAGIAGQLMRALVLLHSNQVIHRDIKPTSILIQRDGLVCITGLGNAHLSSRDSFSGAGAPHGNSMVGTPWYFAPERIMGMAFGASVDLYSTGFVLVEAALGRYPYASIQTQIVKLFETIMSGPSVADMLPPTYSDQCKAFLTICTHANRCLQPLRASFPPLIHPPLPPNLPTSPSKNRSGALQMLRHPWISGAQGLPALQKPVKDLLDRLV